MTRLACHIEEYKQPPPTAPEHQHAPAFAIQAGQAGMNGHDNRHADIGTSRRSHCKQKHVHTVTQPDYASVAFFRQADGSRQEAPLAATSREVQALQLEKLLLSRQLKRVAEIIQSDPQLELLYMRQADLYAAMKRELHEMRDPLAGE